MTARSFAQTVDALGKLATMLGLPPEVLWEDIPGYTAEKIKRINKKTEELVNQARNATDVEDTGITTG